MFRMLLIKNASILDLQTGDCTVSDVLIEDGIIQKIRPNIKTFVNDTIDAKGLIMTPGLCDAHAHIFHNTAQGFIGVDPYRYHLPAGTTCVIDQGSAGADTYELFRQHVMMRTDIMCKEVLNCSRIGMYVSSLAGGGELEDIENLNQAAFCSTYTQFPDEISGVKIRLTPNVCPQNPEKALRLAMQIAEAVGLPLVVHPNEARMEDSLLFDTLRSGDVYAHAYHRSSAGILDAAGYVKPAAQKARDRGVIFDTAHGLNSMVFPVLEAALKQGFEPDIISTDLHNKNCNGPVYDLPTTLSKFLCLGMPLHVVFNKAILAPAKIWNLTDKCTRICAGQIADLACFELNCSRHEFFDAQGNCLEGNKRLIPRFTILKNHLYLPLFLNT